MDLFYVDSYFWEFRNKEGTAMSTKFILRSVQEAQQLLESYNSSFFISHNVKLVGTEEFQAYVDKKESEFITIAKRS